MNTDEFLEETLEDYLLECVCDKVEEVSELKAMLEDIEYLDDKDKLIADTTHCEILDVDDSYVEDYEVKDGKIHVRYLIDFIMQTFIDDEFIWRVQGTAVAELNIPEENAKEWDGFDSKKFTVDSEYKKLAEITKMSYRFIECDTIDN